MRIGIVRGSLTLSLGSESLRGRRLVIFEPVTIESLRANKFPQNGKTLVVIDDLGVAHGQLAAFTEGPEAARPFGPALAPVDAYCALIIDAIHF